MEAGTYTVTLTDDAGCSFTSDPVTIDVLEPATPGGDHGRTARIL